MRHPALFPVPNQTTCPAAGQQTLTETRHSAHPAKASLPPAPGLARSPTRRKACGLHLRISSECNRGSPPISLSPDPARSPIRRQANLSFLRTPPGRQPGSQSAAPHPNRAAGQSLLPPTPPGNRPVSERGTPSPGRHGTDSSPGSCSGYTRSDPFTDYLYPIRSRISSLLS